MSKAIFRWRLRRHLSKIEPRVAVIGNRLKLYTGDYGQGLS